MVSQATPAEHAGICMMIGGMALIGNPGGDMAESPEDRALRQQIKQAAEDTRQARASWGTSQVLAGKYLAARERQLEVLEQVKAVRPEFEVGGGRIDSAIESVAGNIASIKAEIPELPPHGPVDHYYA
jgi:hypothetical protein